VDRHDVLDAEQAGVAGRLARAHREVPADRQEGELWRVQPRSAPCHEGGCVAREIEPEPVRFDDQADWLAQV
jgi:hypothetical protein